MQKLTNISQNAVDAWQPADTAALQAAERKASAERDRRVATARAKRDRAVERAYAAIKRAEEVCRAECEAATAAWHEASHAAFPQ